MVWMVRLMARCLHWYLGHLSAVGHLWTPDTRLHFSLGELPTLTAHVCFVGSDHLGKFNEKDSIFVKCQPTMTPIKGNMW